LGADDDVDDYEQDEGAGEKTSRKPKEERSEERKKPQWPEVGGGMATPERYLRDYHQLFNVVIRGAAESEAPSTSWLASSPSNGRASARMPGGIADYPDDETSGDLHFYERKRNQWNSSTYAGEKGRRLDRK